MRWSTCLTRPFWACCVPRTPGRAAAATESSGSLNASDRHNNQPNLEEFVVRSSIRLVVSASLAALLLASAVATSSANRLSISNRSFRIIWSPLRLSTLEEGGAVAVCSVTLEGSFHSSTVTKVLRALVGHISRASLSRPCPLWFHNGSERVLERAAPATSLPWHVVYEGFTGTLPNISSAILLFRGVTFTLELGGGLCLTIYGEANAGIIVYVNLNASGVILGTIPDSGSTIRRSGPGPFCPEFLKYILPPAGTAGNRFALLGGTTVITVRLI